MSENEQTCGCLHHPSNLSVQQTLEELDFTRGIWTAALDGSYDEVLNCLEKKKIPVDQCDSAGYTALHYASRNGHTSICRLLLDNQASPNTQTRSGGVTPLHRSAYCGHADITELLLKYGANPLLADCDGKLPLHKAAENGHTTVVGILLKAASDATKHKDKRGQTPADYVSKHRADLRTLLE